jgi:hypothetical protein
MEVRPVQAKMETKKPGDMTLVAEHLPSKGEALNSNPSTTKINE